MLKRVATGMVFASHKGLLWACIATLVALSTACSGIDQQPASPASPTISTAMTGGSQSSSATAMLQSAKGSATVPRDVRGTMDGRFDFTRMWGDDWWQFYSDSHATGTMSHLGLAHVSTTHVPNFATGALEQGTFRIVAANGDEIHGTYEGAATYDALREDLVHGAATFVISGGTGRFTGATGNLTASFLETLDDPMWASAKVAWTLAGTVNY